MASLRSLPDRMDPRHDPAVIARYFELSTNRPLSMDRTRHHRRAENADRFSFTALKVTEEVALHFLLRLTGKGTPSLFRYQRVIVTVKP